MGAGTLFVLASWLAEDAPAAQAIPAPALERIRALERFVVEDAKAARRFLAACAHPKPLREIAMVELNEHTPPSAVPAMLQPLRDGHDMGLLSEAGAAAVADPGARLVACAHAEGVPVRPLVGPSSILLALMASGLEGQRFRFAGYLPAGQPGRRDRLAALERESAQRDETQIFIETPYRNDAVLADILAACRDDTRLAVAVELTSPREWVRMDRVAGWRARGVEIGKRPAIFLLHAPRAR